MVRIIGIGDAKMDKNITDMIAYPGGQAMNIAVNAKLQGAQAGFIGCIGDDVLGQHLAKTLDELVSVDAQMQKELGLSMLLGFGLTTDLADSSRRIAAFSLISAGMDKDFYVNGADAQRSAFWRRTG